MLELKNISRIYKLKKAEDVKALDNVSLKFAKTGMVFVLGKSGSGKSTLLNVIGGLDKYDDGELIIKDKSSKNFKQSDFDSYRNTMIGFIFQEYNVLDEFTVGQNIGLALELQGKKATSDKINKILEDVDLVGYCNRKPNELSGGQKQRVAIARALVKDPEIIMADEPTGALDSTTGKQVLKALQELSKTRLVIVISHDREFAETYGSRIIEFKDGQVISDVTRQDNPQTEEVESALEIKNDKLVLKQGYVLTAKDVEFIASYLAKQKVEWKSTVESGQFATTNQGTIQTDTAPYKSIKSKLPFLSSLKIGASALKHKKIRLFFSILLASISFTVFAVADSLGAYNKYNATH